MDWRSPIEQRADIMLGKPVFQGTRLTVENIPEQLGNGASVDDLILAYPRLTRKHIEAAIALAAESLSSKSVIFLDATEVA